jgi:pseudouridine-5'-phosphate glycosidase
MRPPLDIADEVRAALAGRRAVVALESTIIAHGLPWPDNLGLARDLHGAVRAAGAVPAMIAVIDGRIRIGLDDAALERLAKADGVDKISRRDLPVVVARGGDGATTVASTMICAHLAGIRVFATGGIGGVHRGAESSFDVSADLDELARTPVAVVSAGAKSILDLPKTLEVLETRGVPVIGYGTSRFPAFYTADSGLKVPHRADTPGEVAAILRAMDTLGYTGGALVCNPIPAAHALDRDTVEGWIEEAVAAAARDGIAGKAVTPYLLARLNDRTGGVSRAANVALALDNARVGAEIARALTEMAP